MQTSTAIIIAGATIAAAIVGGAAMGPGRYMVHTAPSAHVQRVDTRTGAVAECVDRGDGMHCFDTIDAMRAWSAEQQTTTAMPTGTTATPTDGRVEPRNRIDQFFRRLRPNKDGANGTEDGGESSALDTRRVCGRA